MNDDDRAKMIKDLQEGSAFVIGFAKALFKLREADKDGQAVSLEADEVGHLMRGIRYLRDGAKERK